MEGDAVTPETAVITDAPLATAEQAVPEAAALAAESEALFGVIGGKKRTASGADIETGPPGFTRMQGKEAAEFDIGSDEDDPEIAKLHAIVEKAQKDLDNAKLQKEKEKAASSSRETAALPQGMSLPKVRVHPEGDDMKTVMETMQQMMAQVHALSKDLNDMRA